MLALQTTWHQRVKHGLHSQARLCSYYQEQKEHHVCIWNMNISLHNITRAMHLAFPYLLVGSLLFAWRDRGWGLSLINAVLRNVQGRGTVVGRPLGVALTHFLRAPSSPSGTLAGAGRTHPLVARYLLRQPEGQLLSCFVVYLLSIYILYKHCYKTQGYKFTFSSTVQTSWQAKGHVP